MTAGKVLEWMTARQEGSWEQFKKKVGELSGQTNHKEFQIRDNLMDLGHCEFSGSDNTYKWKVTPPVLVSAGFDGHGYGILCGARYPALEELIKHNLSTGEITRVVLDEGLEAILLKANSARQLSEVAESCGILFQADAAKKLLLTLPSIEDSSWEKEGALPSGIGWSAERLDSADLQWINSSVEETRDASSGLFKVKRKFRGTYLIKTERDQMVQLPPEVAIYRTLLKGRVSILKYDEQEQVFSRPVRSLYRFPPLIRRALALCSGTLPTVEGDTGKKRVCYSKVPADCAVLAAKLLGQRLK